MTQTTQKPTVLNGVPVDQLFGTIEAIEKDTSLASFKFRARNRWIDGGHNRSTVKEFYGAGQEDTTRAQPFVMDADEPPVLLGKDRGANPVEFVLHALAACITTSMVYHAAARGIRIEEVESSLEGDLDVRGILGMSEDIRRGFEQIRINFKIKADVADEQLQELLDMGTKYSPVFDIVTNQTPVKAQVVN